MIETAHRYSDDISHTTIAVFGPALPPPYGGVAVHVERVIAKLRRQHNQVHHVVTVVEYRYRWLFVYLLRISWFMLCVRPKLVYYHTLYVRNSYAELRLLVFLKRFFTFNLVTIDHNSLYAGSGFVRMKERFNTRVVPYISAHILMGDSTYKQHRRYAIADAKNIFVERAFLPQTPTDVPLPNVQGLHVWLSAHSLIITVAITHVGLRDGRDVYGLDTAIECMKILARQYPHVGLLCCRGLVHDHDYFELIMQRIGAYGLEQAIFFVPGVQPLWPLLQHTDLFLRPTLTDGASVSEDEAHYCGVPVVASDVCLRHPKTITYSSGSVEDCSIKVSEVFERGIKAASDLQRSSVHPQSPR